MQASAVRRTFRASGSVCPRLELLDCVSCVVDGRSTEERPSSCSSHTALRRCRSLQLCAYMHTGLDAFEGRVGPPYVQIPANRGCMHVCGMYTDAHACTFPRTKKAVRLPFLILPNDLKGASRLRVRPYVRRLRLPEELLPQLHSPGE